jgi:heptosyltransferase-2
VDLLRNNHLIDSLMTIEESGTARLQVETFDLVINPEADKTSAAVAAIANAREKRGFGLSARGYVFPFNRAAEELFYLGLLDDLKKDNLKTYEHLLCRLAELPWERNSPIFEMTEDDARFSETFRLMHRLDGNSPVVGINTGGGERWALKRWTAEGFAELAKRLANDAGVRVLLLGGPAEHEINRRILFQLKGRVVDTGCYNSKRHFGALVGLCDVVITGDSLALHLGLALGKRVVALFGPTSRTEIDLYGRGEKIAAEMDCLCCYRPNCGKSPNCMESIPVETVYRAVEQQILLWERLRNERIRHASHL